MVNLLLRKRRNPIPRGDGAASARAEVKERTRASDRRKRLERWIADLELHLVEATENENGDGVGNTVCCAGE